MLAKYVETTNDVEILKRALPLAEVRLPIERALKRLTLLTERVEMVR